MTLGDIASLYQVLGNGGVREKLRIIRSITSQNGQTLYDDGKAEANGAVLFAFELIYAGVFHLQGIPQDSVGPLLMIECPRILFPFAREIIATAVRDGGFPPLMLDPVDFVGLYRQSLERQAAAQAAQAKPS